MTHSHRVTRAIALLSLVLSILAFVETTPRSSAGISTWTRGPTTFNNGGSTVGPASTYAPTVAIATDKVERLRATAFYSSSSGGHLQYAGSLTAEYVVQNSNGTLTAVLAATSSFNPTNSNTTILSGIVGEPVQADNHTNFNGGSTLVWSVSGTNAVCTFTNGASAISVYVTIIVETFAVGST
jgi:hypothetical protein